MRKILMASLVAACAFAACKKEPVKPTPPTETHPQMLYTDLHDAEVKYLQPKTVDVNNDGAADFSFGVLLVGDPVLQRDRAQFGVSSGIERNLLNDANDQSPKLQKLEIVSKNHPGYTWWQISHIVLAEKIITATNTSWDGIWKNAAHNYLPIQVEKEQKLYHGWIELSFNTAEEKLVLHRAALSKEAEKDVKAGY